MGIPLLALENHISYTGEIDRRRTFAIISHPDAGKTTLTEKLLLYGGAIHEAGSVRARRGQQQAASDWMELEKQRGISITSAVMQFEYHGHCLNLLDTPGHHDFSEDTYRTLVAADNAVMLIDASKGLEERTRKLFEVCKLSRLPVFTFINKLDRPSKDPLELLDEIEKELHIGTYAVNWPVGTGDRFCGIADRLTRKVHLFERGRSGDRALDKAEISIDDPALKDYVETSVYDELMETLEILDHAGMDLDAELIADGSLTPVFFGSAMNNFGVESFLRHFIKLGMRPRTFKTHDGNSIVTPENPDFIAFVFKLQANMDPRHRDRVAFIRICSGVFEKDMTVNHSRTGKSLQLVQPKKFFAQSRESIDVAYPGDIIGLTNPGAFAIGDTIYNGKLVHLPPLPCFAPELFGYLINKQPSKYKNFHKGVTALQEEGAIQVLQSADETVRHPILGAIGQLQFEVVQYRLASEYGVDAYIEPMNYSAARWVSGGWTSLEKVDRMHGATVAKDRFDQPVILFKNAWAMDSIAEQHPHLKLTLMPHGIG